MAWEIQSTHPAAHSVWEFLPALVGTEWEHMWKYKLSNIYYVEVAILVKLRLF